MHSSVPSVSSVVHAVRARRPPILTSRPRAFDVGRDKLLEALEVLAEHGRELAGYAFFLPAYETGYAARGLYLCDLYVMPERRRRGIGRALVAAVALRARQEGRGFLWWASRAWNDEAKRFYAALGAKTEPVNAHALTFDAFETLAKEGERRSAA